MEKKMPLWLATLVVLLFLGIVFFGRYHAAKNKVIVKDIVVDTFEECAKYYPVMESYPEQCNTPDGRHFVNLDQKVVDSPSRDERVGAGYISGKVTIGPICPVEIEGEPCNVPEEIYTSRELIVYTSDGKTVHDRISLLSDGTYKIAVGPGNYLAQISPAGIGPGEMKAVTVTSFETSTVDFDIDTGIR